ncbi:MAG TPA: hypothetical protein DCY13_02420 [Verrucomicrobiales bacterium]|nr:hypothetical protein [Verrucomicrobiales bacterium]
MQKELLVAECDLQRGIVDVELARLRSGLDWMQGGADWLHRVRPWLPLLVPVAGFVVARRWKSVLRLAGKTVGWRMLWRLFRG